MRKHIELTGLPPTLLGKNRGSKIFTLLGSSRNPS